MGDNEVLIVGAGPTGMTAAIELKRAGMDVRIIDKSDHMAQYSQALVVQARTLEQFQRYGLAEETMAHGRKLHEAKFYSDGKQIVDFKLDHMESRFPFALFIPQSETERVLNSHMESLGVQTERSVELTSLAQIPTPDRRRCATPTEEQKRSPAMDDWLRWRTQRGSREDRYGI